MATETDLRHDQQEPSVTSLVQGIATDVRDLIGHQLALFKTETANDLARTRRALMPMVLGVVVLFVGVIVLALGLAHLLNWAVPEVHLWAAYLIVGGGILVIGGAMVVAGYLAFKAFNPLPDESLQALKENIQWPKKK